MKGATVRENLVTAQYLQAGYGTVAGMFGSRGSLAGERRLRRKAEALAEVLALSDLLDTQVVGLPYGTLKRVEIATVLATDPDLLLLDEPSSGMGPEEARQLGDSLLGLRDMFNLSIAMIEHHVPLVVRVCDHVYCLDFGQLVTDGPPEAVRNHPAGRRRLPRRGSRSGGRRARGAARRARGGRLMALLEVEDLHVGYGFPVLLGISFAVEEGETAVLFGLNGAGKTTTVATIAGLLKPDSGTIRFDGEDVAGRSPTQLVDRGIALVPEGRRVFPALSVANNLRLGAWTRRRNGDEVEERRQLVFEYFPRLAERVDQAAGTLSGGEQQMLAIGRALMSKPRLLLIDEASLGLSPALAKIVFQVVERINDDGVTVIIVEQNVGVLPYADRALIMEKGTLIFSGVGDEIRSANLRESYLGGENE